MNKKQKQTVSEGFDTVIDQDKAMWSTLTCTLPTERKILVAITEHEDAFVQASGHMTEVIHPRAVIQKVKETIDDMEPTAVFIQAKHDDDDEECLDADIVKYASDTGILLIIADAKYTDRWIQRGITPTPCRGDLAFYCISSTMTSQLVDWACERPNGY